MGEDAYDSPTDTNEAIASAPRPRSPGLAAALEAEVDAYVTALVEHRDERGHRLVVRGLADYRPVTGVTTKHQLDRCPGRGSNPHDLAVRGV